MVDNSVQIWFQESMIPTRTISGGLHMPYSTFATLNGDVYVDNGLSNFQVNRWALNATNSTIAMYVRGACYGLFMDIDDNLYCSLPNFYVVVKQSLDNNTNTSIIVGGNTTLGSGPYMLNGPRGIFVDINLDLYVADCGNNRIQLFRSGQLNGTTIIINGSTGTFTLGCPADVVLDIDGYLFIAESGNNRILGSGPSGFRCIAGCTGTSGLASNQLNSPQSLSFDSYGNLFVIDSGNNRLQKFFLSSNSCGEFYK
jgi:sugar lactone lactonase YvrE